MIYALKCKPHVSIEIPSREKIIKFKAAINKKYMVLKNVWVMMEGLKLYLQKSPKQSIQEMFYDGWKAVIYPVLSNGVLKIIIRWV